MKLCVFPNDSIQAYFNKGEIKPRYFNPKNLFNEVHIISLTDTDIDENKVREIVGDAQLKIHAVGKTTLKNYKSKLSEVIKVVREIRPDIIRSYNPLLQGWFGIKSAKDLKIPFVVSIHNNYDKDAREFCLKNLQLLRYLKFAYTGKFIEPYVLSNASKIICAYRFLVPYVKRHGGKDVEVIYNRVYLSRFSPNITPQFKSEIPIIIYVARLDDEKNQECLIRAVKDLNVKLVLVGDGPNYNKLQQLTKDLNITDRINFIRSVPNELLGKYYTSANIFASPIKQGGVSIPMLEAMACGVPVISTSRGKNESEDVDDAIMFSNNTPNDFKNAIKQLIDNKELREKMIKTGLEKVKIINGEVMEEKEATLYRNLLRNNRQT
jgi:glycosyltransferase involved in cell wall biosynthesis